MEINISSYRIFHNPTKFRGACVDHVITLRILRSQFYYLQTLFSLVDEIMVKSYWIFKFRFQIQNGFNVKDTRW